MKRIWPIFLLLLLCFGCGTNSKDKALKKFNQVYQTLLEYHYSNPTSEQLLMGAINGLYASLDDDFTYGKGEVYKVDDKESAVLSTVGFGFRVTIPFLKGEIIVNDVTIDGPAFKAGIRIGDAILFVDGVDVREQYYEKNYELLSGSLGQTKKLGIMRQGNDELMNFNVTLDYLPASSNVSGKMIGDSGYLKISSFNNTTFEDIGSHTEETVSFLEEKGMKSLIIDLRGNLGGSLDEANECLSLFVSSNNHASYYVDGYQLEKGKIVYKKEEYTFNALKKQYPIVLLVDENTASAAEVFIAVMEQEMGYTTIGYNTFGKGIYQQNISIDSNYSIHLSLGKWFYYNKNTNDYQCLNKGCYEPSIKLNRDPYESCFAPGITKSIHYDTVNTKELPNIALMLTYLGYPSRKDGYFDKKLLESLTSYQVDNNLTPIQMIDDELSMMIYYSFRNSRLNIESDLTLVRALEEVKGQ